MGLHIFPLVESSESDAYSLDDLNSHIEHFKSAPYWNNSFVQELNVNVPSLQDEKVLNEILRPLCQTFPDVMILSLIVHDPTCTRYALYNEE